MLITADVPPQLLSITLPPDIEEVIDVLRKYEIENTKTDEDKRKLSKKYEDQNERVGKCEVNLQKHQQTVKKFSQLIKTLSEYSAVALDSTFIHGFGPNQNEDKTYSSLLQDMLNNIDNRQWIEHLSEYLSSSPGDQAIKSILQVPKDEKGFILYAAANGIKIRNTDPVAWAVCNGRLIGGYDPLRWAKINNKLVDGMDPMSWAEVNGKLVDEMNPWYWAKIAERKKFEKIIEEEHLKIVDSGEFFSIGNINALLDVINNKVKKDDFPHIGGEIDLFKNKLIALKNAKEQISKLNPKSKLVFSCISKIEKIDNRLMSTLISGCLRALRKLMPDFFKRQMEMYNEARKTIKTIKKEKLFFSEAPPRCY